MSDSITVSGGTDGTSARFEDMLAVAKLLDQAATDVEDALGFVLLAGLLGAAGDGLDLISAIEMKAILVELASPFGPAAGVAHRLRDDAARLQFAVMAYITADTGIFDEIGHAFSAVGHASVAIGDGALDLMRGKGVVAAWQDILADDPGLVDFVANYSALGAIERAFGGYYPDGHAVVHDLGIDSRAAVSTPPRNLADLVRGLAVRYDGAAGEISVAFVIDADGVRRAIVDIPGTKSWDPLPTSDVTSLSTNARALVGAPTSYEQGVLIAMARAGVRPTDAVMLVGHSEGGMVAVNAARDAVRSERFNITHVVTAGSPIGHTAGGLPARVRVLALENDTDIVPHADGCSNPDRRNITTVTVHHGDGSIIDDHDLRDSYAPGAHDADVSGNASVRDFVDSANDFLDGTTERTHAYLVTRSY